MECEEEPKGERPSCRLSVSSLLKISFVTRGLSPSERYCPPLIFARHKRRVRNPRIMNATAYPADLSFNLIHCGRADARFNSTTERRDVQSLRATSRTIYDCALAGRSIDCARKRVWREIRFRLFGHGSIAKTSIFGQLLVAIITGCRVSYRVISSSLL